jgi:hypothetical protein
MAPPFWHEDENNESFSVVSSAFSLFYCHSIEENNKFPVHLANNKLGKIHRRVDDFFAQFFWHISFPSMR